MSSLDNIIEEILNDAKAQAKEIIDKANIEAKEVLEKAKKESEKESQKIMDKALAEGTQLKERIISNSNLVARDKLLVAKQGVIDKIFEDAKEKLKNIDHEIYLKYVENKLKSLEIKENSEILLTEKEKNIANGKLFGINVSSKTVSSGFSLKNGKILFNNEFSSIIDILKEDLEQEVVNMLFS